LRARSALFRTFDPSNLPLTLLVSDGFTRDPGETPSVARKRGPCASLRAFSGAPFTTMAVCVIDENGNVVWRGKCASTPESITDAVRTYAPPAVGAEVQRTSKATALAPEMVRMAMRSRLRSRNRPTNGAVA
jgi:hypothetical protein